MEFRPADFPHLNAVEWAAFRRMATTQGVDVITNEFVPLDPEGQRATLAHFIEHELTEAQERIRVLEAEKRQTSLSTALPPPTPDRKKPVPFKVDVAKYKGTQRESLPRWIVEMDSAIRARCVDGDELKVTYAMSNLAGNAKTWAYGRRMADPNCFLTYEDFKKDLRDAFEPPKTEFRARTEFLHLRQGKRDVMTYAQHARYLVSCVTEDPIDDATQVSVFMTGLEDGPAKSQLFREFPSTLEEAISRALQEEFSRNQAYVNSASYKPPKMSVAPPFDTTEPMDLSSAQEAEDFAYAQSSQSAPKKVVCSRCQKTGHWSYECLAPRPVPRRNNQQGGKSQPWRGKRRSGSQNQQRPEAKNEKSQ